MQSPVSPAVKLQSAQAVLLSLSVPKPALQAERGIPGQNQEQNKHSFDGSES